MDFATILHDNEERVALRRDGQVFLLERAHGDMIDLIANPRLLQEAIRGPLERTDEDGLAFLPPVRRFRRDVLCTGWNYWDHFEEGIGRRGNQEVERPEAPTFFTKAPNALTGHETPIAYDPGLSRQWDYEGEIALIIGREGRNIAAEAAMDHVFGFTIANDVSQRDLQRRHGGQWLKGKSADRSSPLGPWIVTRDAVDFAKMRITTLVNGETRQDATTGLMAFPLGQLIAELSAGMTLFPGDIVLTGTPSGIGMARVPPVYLAPGDEVIVRVDGLGELRNRVEEVPA